MDGQLRIVLSFPEQLCRPEGHFGQRYFAMNSAGVISSGFSIPTAAKSLSVGFGEFGHRSRFNSASGTVNSATSV